MSFFLKKHLSSTDSEVKDPFLSFGFFFFNNIALLVYKKLHANSWSSVHSV